MFVLCLLLVGVTPILGTSIASINRESTKAGVIIGSKYLLFPPSPLRDASIKEHKIRVGSIKNYYGGLEFDVKGYVLHPHYSPKGGLGKGRTGKDNKDNIALVITAEDLPIGRDNVSKDDLPPADFNAEGPGYVVHWGYPSGLDYHRVDITIHPKANCTATHHDVDCERNYWATAVSCDIDEGAPVYSGNTLVGTVATSHWCREGGNKDLFINSLPHYSKWIKQTIDDEQNFIA